MMHPAWLQHIYRSIGQNVVDVAKAVIRRGKVGFENKINGYTNYKSLGGYYYEFHFLLVYLWAVKRKYTEITGKGLLKAVEDRIFKELGNGILRKAFVGNSPIQPFLSLNLFSLLICICGS